ncbi:hypothetical protein GCM10011514_35910 [Emticicia aquatilis]|uniref:Uncharacterized protein n=1 Tax=Emticicia aquatilis TaxID=1537369 RepID=A0A916YZW9_9BACT|nr:hypothetical protein [Emticicia aquatilis]GGD68610.1 hypothetical protein GCM10011514_35910 [Emticicia aquatilis]
MQELRTGRALQLEGLENARNKVTLGFKCDAGTKISLAQEARQSGMTLSEYVDTIISARHYQNQQSTNSYFNSDFKLRLEKAKQENQQILRALEFYENNTNLKNLLFQHQGKQIQFQDAYGRNQEIRIQSVADIFTVIVHSFKTN